jgi:hypothetical protein
MRRAAVASIIGPLLIGSAYAHDAPAGWSYDKQCCSGMDCRAVNQSAGPQVRETPRGYRISTTGEVIPYHDSRIKDSPDGEFHWCSHGGRDTAPTICLYAPVKGY